MTRLVTSGFESQIFSTTVAQNGEGQSSSAFGTVAVETSVVNPGGSACSLKVTQAGGLGGMQWTGLAIPNGTGMFVRVYFRASAVSQSGDIRQIVTIVDTGGTLAVAAYLTTAGKLRLLDAVGAQIGSDSAALTSSAWYEITMLAALASSPTTSNGTTTLSYRPVTAGGIDSRTSVAAGVGNQNLGTVQLNGVTLGDGVLTPTGTFYFDDLAVNNGSGSAHNTYPDGGHVVHLMPASDQSVGTGWEQPKTAATDTTDLFDSVNNVPPVGVAHLDADANNLKYIFNAASLGAASAFSTNTTDYTTAGFPNNAIRVVQGLFRTGGASTTGTNDGSGRISFNPVDSGATTFTAAYDIVSGTEPSSWNVFRSEQLIDPTDGTGFANTVIRSSGPRLVISKTLLSNVRVHMCDYMAAVVEVGDTLITLATSAGASSATLTLTAPTFITLAASAGLSTASLALTAATAIPLGTAAASSSASLTLTAATRITLDTAAGTSTATLALTAPTYVVLGTAAATSSATLAVTAATQVPLGTSAATSTASLALTAATQVPLDASAGASSATLSLTSPATVPLDAAAGQSDATLELTAPAIVLLGAAAGQSAASLPGFHAPGIAYLTLDATGQSDASLTLTARTYVVLDAATGEVTATLTILVPYLVSLDPADGVAGGPPLEITTPTEIVLQEAFGISAAALVLRAVHFTRWDGDTDSRWATSTDSRWGAGTDERWGTDSDDRWAADSDTRWTSEPEST